MERYTENVLEDNIVDDCSNPSQASHSSMVNDVSIMSTMEKNDNTKTNNAIPLDLNQYTKYVQSISKEFLFKYCACGYFKNAEAVILEEMDKIKLKFDTKTCIEYGNIIKTELIIKNMKTIVEMENCGVVYMLKNNQYDDLKWMYNFLRSVNDGVKVMFDGMRPYFHEEGASTVIGKNGNSDVKTYFRNLLDLKGKFDNLNVNLFNNDTLFDEIVGDEFNHFLRLNPSITEYLSFFIDEKLRKGKHTYIRCNPEADIDKVMYMIKYLSNKATFEHFYQNHLSNRLLNFKSVHMVNETEMIYKLDNAFGNDRMFFINKMRGMVNDKFALSNFVMRKYKEHLPLKKFIFSPESFAFDIDMQIIDPINWPVDPNEIHKIPSFGESVFNLFKTIFEGEIVHKSKKSLKLLPQFGTVELNATFYGKCRPTRQLSHNELQSFNNKYEERMVELVVTTYQMCVLDLFNDYNTLTFEEILIKTKIPKESLIKALQGMMEFGDHLENLILKFPMSENINSTDKFYVNEAFQCI